MTPNRIPFSRDLVLVGGGHAHALVLRMWGMKPLPGARLTVIDPGPAAPYTGMLPGYVAGHYRLEDLEIDLVRLCRFAGARLVIGPATRIDTENGIVQVEGRGPVAFDVASIDVGIHSALPEIPGFGAHGVPAKPLGAFAAAWSAFLAGSGGDAAVIGGGIAGIELALAMNHALRVAHPGARVSLIEATDSIAAATPAAKDRLAAELDRAGVAVRTGAEVTGVLADRITLADGEDVPSAFTVSAAGARAHGWLADSGLPVTDDGFVRVGETLRVEGQDALFAAGDCAHLSQAPRPKAGVFAVRAAGVLNRNLRAALAGGPMRPFRPQRHYLKLVSLGGKSALAERGGLAFAAPALWRWKDRIDRRFMDRLNHLPKMAEPALPAPRALGGEETTDPLCGGCGSKVFPGALTDVLAARPPSGRPDILSGPGDDAAVVRTGGVQQVLTTDHLRAFTEDFGLMARIAAVHALGDLWSMSAQPQTAMVSLILPRMTARLQARTLDEIMTAATEVMTTAGAEIVGGHSSMGAELTIGFSLTGLCDTPPILQSGGRAGDALILTRPIGSGTLLAAEMRGQARGHDIARLLSILARPQADAAALLRPAHAMTDVTGFGLAGHLGAMCRASGAGAEIDLGAVPVFEGAEALAAAGVRSTIWQANRDAAPVTGADGPRGALLHDPQTAGGLLAAVAPDDADALVASLRAAGHQAGRIGRLVPEAGLRVV